MISGWSYNLKARHFVNTSWVVIVFLTAEIAKRGFQPCQLMKSGWSYNLTARHFVDKLPACTFLGCGCCQGGLLKLKYRDMNLLYLDCRTNNGGRWAFRDWIVDLCISFSFSFYSYISLFLVIYIYALSRSPLVKPLVSKICEHWRCFCSHISTFCSWCREEVISWKQDF